MRVPTVSLGLTLIFGYVVVPLLMGNVSVHAADSTKGSVYSCLFIAGNWNRADWVRVQTPRAERFGDWVQQEGYIVNQVPEGVVPGEFLGELAETYSSSTWGLPAARA